MTSDTRHPLRSQVRLRIVPCDLCGSNERTIRIANVRDYDLDWPDTYNVVTCNKCGLAYRSPQPHPDDIHLYYPANYNPFNPAQVEGLLAHVKTAMERQKAKKLQKILPPHARILDAGCSYGGFLARLRELGFTDLFGIDTDPQSIEYARTTLQLNAKVMRFEDVPETVLYDCVIMKYVLDHLDAPAVGFEKLARLLRPGGLFILQLPNRASWETDVFGRFWHGWEIPRHAAYFTKEDIMHYGEKFGFRIRDIEYEVTPNNWIWGLRYIALDYARPLVWFFSIKNPFLVLLFTPLGLIAAFFKRSGRVEYVLERVA